MAEPVTYTSESLRAELDAYEERFDVTSEKFFENYVREEFWPGVPGFDSFVWADSYQEWKRLREQD